MSSWKLTGREDGTFIELTQYLVHWWDIGTLGVKLTSSTTVLVI